MVERPRVVLFEFSDGWVEAYFLPSRLQLFIDAMANWLNKRAIHYVASV